MSAFEMVHQDRIAGKLVCFDRLIIKGHITKLCPAGAFKGFLDAEGVLLKNFGSYVTARTDELKAHAKAMVSDAGRPYVYLGAAHTKAKGSSKEDLGVPPLDRTHVYAACCDLKASSNSLGDT